MRFALTFFISTLIGLSIFSCARHGEEALGRPDAPEQPAPDYTHILSDRSVRFENDTLSVRYDDGGVLYLTDGPAHRLVNLETGINIAFNSEKGSLTINSRPVNIEECRLIADSIGLRWYILLPDEQVMVVEK